MVSHRWAGSDRCRILVLLALTLFPSLQQVGAVNEEPASERKSTEDFTFLAGRAATAFQEGKTEEALSLFRRGLELNPEWEEGWWYLGVLHYEAHQWKEAAKAFRVVTDLNPDMGPAWVMAGACQYQLRKYYRAAESIDRGLQAGLGGNAALRFSAFYHKAVLLTRIEEYERAFTILYSLAKQQPTNEMVATAMGLCMLRIPLSPGEMPPAWRPMVLETGRAFQSAAIQEEEQARRKLERLLQDHPDFPNLHYAFGQFLVSRGEPEAAEMFQRELELNPHHIPAHLQLAWFYLNRGDAERGLPFAEKARRLDPDSASPYYVLGRIFLDRGRIDDAIEELEAARERAPESSQIRQFLARAYFRGGRREDARRELAEVDRLQRILQEREQGLILSGMGQDQPTP